MSTRVNSLLLQGATEGLLAVRRGKIVDANVVISDATGIGLEQLVGAMLSEVFGQQIQTAIDQLGGSSGCTSAHAQLRPIGLPPLDCWINVTDIEGNGDQIQVIAFRFESRLKPSERKTQSALITEADDIRLRPIIENSPIGIAISRQSDGLVLYANMRLAEMHGRDLDSLIGSYARDYYVDPNRRLDLLKMVKSQGIALNEEVNFSRKDGSTFWVLLSLVPTVLNGEEVFWAWVYDISELKETLTALNTSEKRIKDIAESAIDWFWEMGPDLRFTYVSDRVEEAVGLSDTDVLGKTRFELVDHEELEQNHEKWEQHRDLLRERKPFKNFEYSVHLQDKGIQYVQISGKPFFSTAGEFLGYRGAGRDVTALRRWQTELAEAKDSAEKANQAKSAHVAAMSHELRTPLNSIIGLTEMILEEADALTASDNKESLERMLGAENHLLSLLDGILDLAKIESGELELSRDEFQVSSLVDNVIATIGPLAREKKIELKVSIDRAPGLMCSDEFRIKQVLINLLGNACKFTNEGMVELVVKRSGKYPQDRLVFKVVDSGIGIDANKIDTLFDPFSQAEKGTVERFGGTGLGLAISRHLCRLLGGDIFVESSLGQGSVFTVELPVVL